MSLIRARAALRWWTRREKALAKQIDKARAKQQDPSLSTLERDNAKRQVTAARGAWRLAHQKKKTAKTKLAEVLKSKVSGISGAGVAFIRKHEGVVLHPYNDSRKNATIGVGHLLHMGPFTTADVAQWKDFDNADADELLDRDLDHYEDDVMRFADKRRAAGSEVTQNQVDAQVSFAFNVGEGGYSTSTLARLYGSGSPPATVAAQFDRWHSPPEITGRRDDEKSLFLKPN